jgi:hypothetical protein
MPSPMVSSSENCQSKKALALSSTHHTITSAVHLFGSVTVPPESHVGEREEEVQEAANLDGPVRAQKSRRHNLRTMSSVLVTARVKHGDTACNGRCCSKGEIPQPPKR